MKYKLTKKALKEATWDLTDPEVDPRTGGITHTVKYKPDLNKAFLDFKEIKPLFVSESERNARQKSYR